MSTTSMFVFAVIASLVCGQTGGYRYGMDCTDVIDEGTYRQCDDAGLVNCGSPGTFPYDALAANGCCPFQPGVKCVCDLDNPNPSLRTVCNTTSGSASSASVLRAPWFEDFE